MTDFDGFRQQLDTERTPLLLMGKRPRLIKALKFSFAIIFFSRPIIHGEDSEYLGQFSINEHTPNSISNPFGYGSPYKSDGLNNPFSRYGSQYSHESWSTPYAVDAPRLYDSQGNYHGRLSTNQYDPESISNPFGRYGSKYSPDSVNNPHGFGGQFNPDSPNNPFGKGLAVIGGNGRPPFSKSAPRTDFSNPMSSFNSGIEKGLGLGLAIANLSENRSISSKEKLLKEIEVMLKYLQLDEELHFLSAEDRQQITDNILKRFEAIDGR